MTARVLRPVLTFATVSALLIAALSVYFAFQAGETRADGPGVSHFEATNTQTLTSNALSAPRAATTVLTVPAGDHNFSNVITIEPLSETITPSCNIPGARDRNNDGDGLDPGETTTCLPAGVSSGTQTSGATLGLTNNACNSGLTVVHDLYAVPTPNNETAPRTSTNIVFPRPEGSTDRFGGWQVGSAPPAVGGTAPAPGAPPTQAAGTSLALNNYPSYLLDLFDPDDAGPANPAVPEAVYGGLTSVAGSWVPLYFVQFSSGVLNVAFATDAPNPFSRLAPALGHPNQSVLNDPTATLANPSSITDFCSPLVASNASLSAVGGVTRATNPSTAQTHMTLSFSSGLRDLDNDGYENALDSCPRAANTEDPRASSGPDTDMLDSVCDPTPGVDTGLGDHDGDLFPNAQDTCPTVSNPTQSDSESTGAYASTAFDGGTEGDSIGDACDVGPAVAVTVNNVAYSITPSATVGNGHWHIQANPIPKCYGSTDADNDGYCSAQDGGVAENAAACQTPAPPAGPANACVVLHNAWTTTAAYSAALSAFDTDRGGGDTAGGADTGGVGTIPCAGGAADVCPEIGFDTDWFEDYVGTDPTMPCSQNTGTNNEPVDNWLWDFNDDRAANISDIVFMGASFNAAVNDTTAPAIGTQRTDVNSTGRTDISDVTAFGAVFNKSCRMVNGTFGTVQ